MKHAPAKVTRPRVVGAVSRARLHRALDAARRRGAAAWLRGQPGSGKTTVAATWVETRRIQAIWMKLDAGDAELATFFHYLRLAARGVTRRRLSLPRFGPEYGGEIERFARNAFRSLYAALPRGTVLVLDDCHEVPPEAPLHSALRAGIEELTPGMAMVFASRAGPPAALSRANGGLVVLEDGALELTRAEALELARARGFRGRGARVEALRREVHGWAAGLVLALACAEDGAEVDVRTATFDYFAGEVFERADPATRRVLLEAALLETPTGDLLAEVTGIPGAARLLGGIARRGLFTLGLEGGASVFEFHALFREFLLARGREELPPGRADAVRRHAATLLAGRGGADAEAAMALFGQAGAHEEAAAVVAREAERALRAGRTDAVLRWIERLPPAVRDGDPWILCWEGNALVARDPAGARRRLEPALAAFEASGEAAGVWLTWSALVESILLEWSDFTALPARMHELERLRERFPFPSREVELRVTLATVAVLAHLAPEFPHLDGWVERALAIALEPGEARVRLVAGAYFIQCRVWWFGELERALPVIAAVAPLANDPGMDPAAAILWLAIEATLHAASGDAVAAARCAGAARRRAAHSGVHVWDVVLHVHEIWTALGRDDVRAAREATARFAASARPGNEMDRSMVRWFEALVALRAGDRDAAVRFAAEADELARRTNGAATEAVAKIVLARTCALSESEHAARSALAAARVAVDPLHSPCFDHLLALIEAELHLRTGHGEGADAALSRALALSRAGIAHAQYFFSRVDLARLAGVALRRGTATEEARELVRSRRLSPPPDAGAEWPRDVSIRALGPFVVERHGAPVSASVRAPQRPLELLRVLIAFGGRDVGEDRVAEALWPDSDGDAAHHALETTLYRLRRLIGKDVVLQRDGRLSISGARCWVDALELEVRLSDALAALRAGGGPAPAPGEAARIAALYTGPLLAECQAAWAIEAREALRKKLGRWLATIEGMRGDPADAARLRDEISARDLALASPALLRLA